MAVRPESVPRASKRRSRRFAPERDPSVQLFDQIEIPSLIHNLVAITVALERIHSRIIGLVADWSNPHAGRLIAIRGR